MGAPSSRRALLPCAVALLFVLSIPAAGVGVHEDHDNPCAGIITEPASGDTVISVQGGKFSGEDQGKKPARLIGVGPNGEIKWVQDSTDEFDAVWSYDVDPLPNGNLFVVATIPDKRTAVYEYDPKTGERVWVEELDIHDTHDVDPIGENAKEFVVANMRNYNETSGVNEDRIFVYNRTQGEIVWEWHFNDHYPEDVGGNYSDDWTHVNDIDQISDDQFLVSPRNFDQAIIVNRTTGEIDQQLGENGDYDTLYRQHNPDYLESDDGASTLLVADSNNERAVEYEQRNGEWERVWEVGDENSMHWPRDADRLPNGNTLITDSRNHRVIEVTPTGEIVWEVYTPWLPYEAERIPDGRIAQGGSDGPTMSDVGVSGFQNVTGSADLHLDDDDLYPCDEALEGFDGESQTERETSEETEDNLQQQRGFGIVPAVVALVILVVRRR